MWPLGRADALQPQARGFPVLWPLLAPRRQPGSRPPLRHRPRAERPRPTRKNILCCRPFLVSLCRQPSRMNSCKTATGSLGAGPGPRGRWQLAGGLGSPSPLNTSPSPSAGALAGPAQMPTHPLACTLLPPACSFRPAGAGWVPADSVPRLSVERLRPRLATGGCAEGCHAEQTECSH